MGGQGSRGVAGGHPALDSRKRLDGGRTTEEIEQEPLGGEAEGSGAYIPWEGGALEPLLKGAFESGAREYGPLPLALESFAQRALDLVRQRLLSSSLPCTPERMAEVLAHSAGRADLYLSIACDWRLGGAWEAFTKRFLPRVAGLADRLGASRSDAEQLVQELPGHLVLPPRGGGSRTRFGTYNGAVPLFDWLAVIVRQRLVDIWRERGHAPREATDAELGAARIDGDPAHHLLAVETAAKLEEALAEAWKRLSTRATAALLFKYADGLPQKDIAALLGVGEPRVSKILKVAEERVRFEVVRHDLPDPRADLTLWRALRDAIAKHMARNRPSAGDPPKGSSPHGP